MIVRQDFSLGVDDESGPNTLSKLLARRSRHTEESTKEIFVAKKLCHLRCANAGLGRDRNHNRILTANDVTKHRVSDDLVAS
jgi:hypothetical protein